MTFPIAKCVFADFETRHPPGVDLKISGGYRYANGCLPILLAYAIGEGKVEVVEDIEGLSYAGLPEELRQAIADPDTHLVAWNASFDRAVWNYAVADSPFLPPEKVVDAMAQAAAANLPASLQQAHTAIGGEGKQVDGKKLIKLFSDPAGPAPAERPEEWARFVSYAAQDIEAMREVWLTTLPLPLEEWRVYWANEAIGERGIGIDLAFCRAAAALSVADIKRSNQRLALLTDGAITSISQHVRIADWVYARLPDDESRMIMTTALLEPEDEDDEAIEYLPEKTIARGVVERLLDYLRAREGEPDPMLMEVLELREFGASAAPKKYQAALNQEVNGRLRGQIIFNGAAQTGRFSGRGVQPQNLTRTPLGGDYGIFEPDAVDMIVDGCSLEALAALGGKEVPSRKLALLVRPAIVAAPGKTLIKSDYSQIEARVSPWLSDSPGGEVLLESFRESDRDPSAPDLYVVTAAGMLKKPPEEVTKAERQIGKVASLACQFQGSVGALASMAANYRLYIPPDEARRIVDTWRVANPWASAFWANLWAAALQAYRRPGHPQQAGRIGFVYDARYLEGSLFMLLPSGRTLTYPWCRWRTYERRDKKTRKVLDTRETLTFRRPHGFCALYAGLLCENATQATAADFLRESLVALHGRRSAVLHAHDEVVLEEDESDVEAATADLIEAMTFDREWAEGLPLAVDTTVRWWYSAARIKEEAA